ncbi:MAG TPA: ABC transporter permease [bacterium]|nr:ABC transporter permease [bacterium]
MVAKGHSKRLIWPIVALGMLLLLNMLFTPGFFRLEMKNGRLYGSSVDILNRAAPVAIVCLGMTLVIATGGVDLSVGALMGISGSVAALLVTRTEHPLSVVVLLSISLCVLAGLLSGALVSWLGVQPIVATLVLMVSGRGVAQLMTDGQIITFRHAGFEFIGGGSLFCLPFTVTLVLAALLVTAVLTRKTVLGLFIEAVGDNPTASKYAGVAVHGVKVFVYGFSGLCAAIAGLIVTSDIRAADASNAGLYLELDAILAVVIGGTALTGGRFSLIGSLIGALIIQTLTTTILTRGVPVEHTLVVKALVVLAVCLLQSDRFRDLFVKRSRRNSP